MYAMVIDAEKQEQWIRQQMVCGKGEKTEQDIGKERGLNNEM